MSSSQTLLLQCKNLEFAYERERVLEGVDLEVYLGDFLAIIGPNGGGKSTLGRLLVGLLCPTRGELLYAYKGAEGPTPCSGLVGYVPQDTSVNKEFPIRALDVVLMGFLKASLWGSRPTLREKQEALSIMERLNLLPLAHRRIGELSGGQRQKVLIARALCGDPPLLVLDEPTANLDLEAQEEIRRLLENLSHDHGVVLISHDPLAFLQSARRILYVNRRAFLHNRDALQDQVSDQGGHFCGVEWLKNFSQSTRR